MPLRRLIYLSPTFRPYRVPVFDALRHRVGEEFTVVAHSGQRQDSSHRAYELGEFRRKFVQGWRIRFGAKHSGAGKATPIGAFVSPTLPLVLIGLRPQVVIANNFGTWTLLTLLMGYRTVIFWEGTHHTERTVKPWRRLMRQWMAGRAKSIVVNGGAARDYVMQVLSVPKEKIFVGGMCPDPVPERYRPVSPRQATKGETIRFLFVGQLIKRKAADRLVQAAAILRDRAPEGATFEIGLLGGGPEKADLEQQVSALGLGGIVRFVDYVAPDRVWEIYQDFHVFVLPTRQDNWPLVIPEAMSIGMPVLISRNAGSVCDLVREGENGFVFDPEDPEDIARQMGRYLESPELVERHGARGLELVVPHTPECAADTYVAAAEHALGGKSVDLPVRPTTSRT